jgi:hypothetical protein
MLILDVAEHDLDEILHRDEAVGTPILIDDKSELRPGRLHLGEQVDRGHRGRHEQHASHQRLDGSQRRLEIDRAEGEFGTGLRPASALGGDGCPRRDPGYEIADMDHAARIVERLAIDGQARMASRLKDIEEVRKRDVDRHRDDVGPRDHDIIHALSAQAQNILEHCALFGREPRFLLGPVALENIREVLADGRGSLEPERDLDAVEEAVAVGFMRLLWRTGTSIVGV